LAAFQPFFGISKENWTFNFSTTQIFIVSLLSSAAKKISPLATPEVGMD
jgi:hypothetical protein